MAEILIGDKVLIENDSALGATLKLAWEHPRFARLIRSRFISFEIFETEMSRGTVVDASEVDYSEKMMSLVPIAKGNRAFMWVRIDGLVTLDPDNGDHYTYLPVDTKNLVKIEKE